MNNEEQVAPVQDVQEEVAEQEVVEETTTQEETQVEAPVEQSTEEVEQVEEVDPLAYTNYIQPQPYQFNQTDGYVDPNEVAAQVEQRVLQQVQFQRQEAKMWEAIEKKHPQIAQDKELRELVLNQRIAEAVQGKSGNLIKIADKVMSRFTDAKSEGRVEANVSKKVQKAASLETATNNTGESKSDDVMERISRGDQSATDQLLNQWISEGKI